MNRHFPNRRALLLLCIASAAILVVSFQMMGCAESGPTTSATSSAQTPAVQPPAASITVCNETPDGCAPGTSFSLATLRDLSVHVQWTNVAPGTRTQTLQVLDPGGGSYKVKNSSFVVADGTSGQETTDVLIPISGSMIAERQITGAWTIQVMLDGQPISSQSVTLQP
jgi:hypothetical protein